MKNWEPQDWVALGLWAFIMLYLIMVFILDMMGHQLADAAGARSKEILIYIIGVLSGYIGIKKVNNNK